ncbi:MAG: threonine ammonia-lyase [Oligoflexia bacterium]|nr:threonine ammonia-lyase [Oligoflexia bacterium]
MPSQNPFGLRLADIQDAKREILRYLEPSPLIRNAWLSELLGCELYLKLENMQPIGSFKIRGAIYKISKLTAEERKRGVIAASAGNHAQGVAWAARRLGVRALIVMPKGAPLVKIQNTQALGAEIVLAGENYDEAFSHAQMVAQTSKMVMIPAFADQYVIAGQGTVALELLDQLPDLEVICASIGGGGLMSGIALAIRELHPQTMLIGCQASGATAMLQSIRRGEALTLDSVHTFADGIAVRKVNPNMLELLSHRLDLTLEADDEDIAAAILSLMEKAKVIAEGAGALPLAVLEKIRDRIQGKKVVVVVSGGNIDVNLLSRIIDRGLIRAQRRLRINVLLHDKPGSLARLTELIANQGANVLQAIHDRSEPSTRIDQTDVALTLETRGPEHSQSLIEALRQHVLPLDVDR